MSQKIKFVAFSMMCTFVLALMTTMAVQAATHAPKTKTVKVWACSKGCDVTTAKSGKCPACGAKMAKVNAAQGYVCEDCHYASSKPGNCPDCKMKLEKATYTYECPKCHATSAKPGTCKHCNKTMEMHVLKPMKPKAK